MEGDVEVLARDISRRDMSLLMSRVTPGTDHLWSMVVLEARGVNMSTIHAEKLEQAVQLIRDANMDVWVTFVRESVAGGDPALSLILEGGMTWRSALMVTRDGRKVGVVGSLDASILECSGNWDEVVTYDTDISKPLMDTLDRLIPQENIEPRIAVNMSHDDALADGISVGMYRFLRSLTKGTRFDGSLVSAEPVIVPLRARKTTMELEHIRNAVHETNLLFHDIGKMIKIGISEKELFDQVHSLVDRKGFGYAWEPAGDPIVDIGPDSSGGHGLASPDIRLKPGQIVHMDFGIKVNGYCSDMQRCWYVADKGEKTVPADVKKAFEAVTGAIRAGAAQIKEGVLGRDVDAAARDYLVSAGWPEYQHALGHQVGQLVHDGGALLGPEWERYGDAPRIPLEVGQVFTVELGVDVPGRGHLGIEEMVVVTEDGYKWLTDPCHDLGYACEPIEE